MSGTLEPRAGALPEASLRIIRAFWPIGAVAGLVFLTAYDKASFGLAARATTAIVAVWAVLLAFGLGVWPRARVPRPALLFAGLFAAFAAWTFASIFWARSAENAFTEFNRVTLYLVLYVIAVCASTRVSVRHWANGLTVGITAIAGVALISRLFPSAFSLQGFPTFLPGLVTRLSFPIGYWNALAIFAAFACPLWLGVATRAGRWWQQAAALMPFPWLASVIYLTSSRGGIAAVLIGTIAFLATTARRWTAFGTVLVAAAGSVSAIAVLLPRHELVDGPIRSHQSAVQGHTAFLLILALSLGTAAVYALGLRIFRTVTPSPTLGWIIVVVLAVGVLVAAVASHPGQRLESFKQFSAVNGQSNANIRSHLLSGSGSGRWQFWTAALHEWESAPIVGRGAGSYQAWWAEHAPFAYFVRNAHSLYLEVLGELGLVGFLFLAGALVYGGVVAVRNTLHRRGEEQVLAASLLGVVAAFFFGAGVEWIWQLPAVAGIGVVCLGLLIGPASSSEMLRPVAGDARFASRRVPRFAIGLSALATGWFVLCAQAIPWLADLQLKASAAAVERSDGHSALRHALDARSIQPWAASPYLQLALVNEQRGDLPAARRWIEAAIERDSIDWRLWLVAARLEIKQGDVAAARKTLLRAQSLNPRSSLFGAPR